jgi:poly(A) polymerase
MQTFGLRPCKMVGDLKTKLRDAILDGHIKNNETEGMQYLLQAGKELNLIVQKN